MENLPLQALQAYPPYNNAQLYQKLQDALLRLNKKIIVLDDDPTGVQTVHDVSVYTNWQNDTMLQAFLEPGALIFIMTNSRSFTAQQTQEAHAEMAQAILYASAQTGKDFLIISRSDSTLRGHYPLETQTLKAVLEAAGQPAFDAEVLMPFFMEGGRYTIDNVHYVKQGDALVPAAQTEFAQDKTFGYQNSHLGLYCQEKTQGAFLSADMTYISLQSLRGMQTASITQQLCNTTGFQKVIVNAIAYEDVAAFVLALIDAMGQGKRFLFRTAAALPKVLGNISNQPLLSANQLVQKGERNGGIVVIGSHVQKTTEQFDRLRQSNLAVEFIEFNQHLVLQPGGLQAQTMHVAQQASQAITQGKTAVVYTRRDRFDLDTDDKQKQLEISVQISAAIANIIPNLSARPGFIVAKGGITSSDIGVKSLRVKKATVMGQILSGIPVWKTGEESLFPNMPYVIFPGNVGEADALESIVGKLMENVRNNG